MSMIKYFFTNVVVLFIGIFIRRDKKVLLFGSWMGERYADNSRFLYEYLSLNKDNYSLKRVIWVSDSEQIIDMLRKNGLEVYRTHSMESYYWHLKAGVHFVCNMYAKTGKYKGDILGQLSAGAKKVQLWHGVGIKACGKLRVTRQSKGIMTKVKHVFSKVPFGPIFTVGCWKNRYHLTTSPENSRVAIFDYGVKTNHVIEANYPRLNLPSILMDSEIAILKALDDKKKNMRAILFCPTFREMRNETNYENPTDNSEFVKFLQQNNMLWIEKRHFASDYVNDNRFNDNVFYIDSKFDINLLYRSIDVLVTDYSSISSDCVYRRIPIVSFIPDYDQYEACERGFVSIYDSYYPGEKAFSLSELEEKLQNTTEADYFVGNAGNRYDECRAFLYNDNPCELDWIYAKICEKLKIK